MHYYNQNIEEINTKKQENLNFRRNFFGGTLLRYVEDVFATFGLDP